MGTIGADSNLLELAKAGDQEAFEELIEPYRRELLVHCYRILGSLEDAEDMLRLHLIMDGDEQQVVHEIGLDPRRFRINNKVRPIKLNPF